MYKRLGYYAFGGLLIGAMFGRLWAGTGNPMLAMLIGAVTGIFIGWLIAAAVIEQAKQQKKDK